MEGPIRVSINIHRCCFRKISDFHDLVDKMLAVLPTTPIPLLITAYRSKQLRARCHTPAASKSRVLRSRRLSDWLALDANKGFNLGRSKCSRHDASDRSRYRRCRAIEVMRQVRWRWSAFDVRTYRLHVQRTNTMSCTELIDGKRMLGDEEGRK